MKVVIDNVAQSQLRSIYYELREVSMVSAEQVLSLAIATMKGLVHHYDKHPLDRFRLSNDGAYRAYLVSKYWITYHISTDQISVINIHDSSTEPQPKEPQPK